MAALIQSLRRMLSNFIVCAHFCAPIPAACRCAVQCSDASVPFRSIRSVLLHTKCACARARHAWRAVACDGIGRCFRWAGLDGCRSDDVHTRRRTSGRPTADPCRMPPRAQAERQTRHCRFDSRRTHVWFASLCHFYWQSQSVHEYRVYSCELAGISSHSTTTGTLALRLLNELLPRWADEAPLPIGRMVERSGYGPSPGVPALPRLPPRASLNPAASHF